MEENERKEKFQYVKDSVNNGTFVPRPRDLKEFHNFGSLPLHEQDELIEKVYGYAKRELRYYNTALCMFDVLGYSNIISKNDSNLLSVFENIIMPLVEQGIKDCESATEFWKILPGIVDEWLSDTSNKRKEAPKIESLFFADTIIFYVTIGKKTHPVFERIPIYQIELLTWAARYLFTHMLNHEVLLRGSIGFGECLLTKKPIAYLGSTIIEVHSVESIQQWGGLTYAPSATKLIKEDMRIHHGIISYKTPFKDDTKSRELHNKLFGDNEENYVLDWTLLVDLDIGSTEWIKRESENEALEDNVRKLYKNTLDFYESQSIPRRKIAKYPYEL